MTSILMGPAFKPAERFYLLTLAVERLPLVHHDKVRPYVTKAALTVLLQAVGRASHAEAYTLVERARVAVMGVETRNKL